MPWGALIGTHGGRRREGGLFYIGSPSAFEARVGVWGGRSLVGIWKHLAYEERGGLWMRAYGGKFIRAKCKVLH